MAGISQRSVTQEKAERKKALRAVYVKSTKLLTRVNQLRRRMLVSLDNRNMLDVGTAVAVAEKYNEVVVETRALETILTQLFLAFEN